MYEILCNLHFEHAQAKIGLDNVATSAVTEIMKAMYEALHALDITSSAILIFNGVVITAAAFAAEKDYIPRLLRCWAIIVIVLGLIASGLCMRVTHISYAFYGKVDIQKSAIPCTPNAATESQSSAASKPEINFKEEFAALDREITRRTWYFWGAWWISMFIVVASIAVIFWAIFKERRRRRTATP
jgi:hypothetical protein